MAANKPDFEIKPGCNYMHEKSQGVYTVIAHVKMSKKDAKWVEVDNIVYLKFNGTDKTVYERDIKDFKASFIPY
jgi:hypothetical protein